MRFKHKILPIHQTSNHQFLHIHSINPNKTSLLHFQANVRLGCTARKGRIALPSWSSRRTIKHWHRSLRNGSSWPKSWMISNVMRRRMAFAVSNSANNLVSLRMKFWSYILQVNVQKVGNARKEMNVLPSRNRNQTSKLWHTWATNGLNSPKSWQV